MAKGRTTHQKFAVNPTMRIIVLCGQDPFQITMLTRQAIETLEAEHGEVERFDFDGEEAELADILDELRSYGLIQRHKVVVIDRAEKFLAANDRNRPAMESYARNPVDSATLIMRAETWRAGNLDKHIAKVGLIHKVVPPSETRSVRWCTDRAKKEYGVEMQRDAAELLVTLIGADLSRLDMEIGKLAACCAGERPIERQDVKDLVGMSREDKVWALQMPLAAGDTAGSLRMLRELMDISQQPQELILWAICDLLRKLHAAAQLLKHGESDDGVSNFLKLWGDSRRSILTTARRHDPALFASLFDAAIRTDHQNKSGVGDSVRSLEALALRIADSMGQAAGRGSSSGRR